jgi:hypothetical protein
VIELRDVVVESKRSISLIVQLALTDLEVRSCLLMRVPTSEKSKRKGCYAIGRSKGLCVKGELKA